jgi:hypothetical protein
MGFIVNGLGMTIADTDGKIEVGARGQLFDFRFSL